MRLNQILLYALEKYVPFRRDRRERIGCGVALYVLESAVAEYERLSSVESENEDIWLRLQLKNRNRSLTLCSTYRPPNSNAMEFISNLEESIQKLSTNEQLLIAGDFNAHHVDWLESDDTDTCGELLSELFNTYSLDQIVHFPTNLHLGKLKGCIDLIATNISQINLTSSSPLGKSDHVVLIGTISNLVPSMKPSRYIWCWNKANVHGLQEAISKESWCDILDCEDVDIAWTHAVARQNSLLRT